MTIKGSRIVKCCDGDSPIDGIPGCLILPYVAVCSYFPAQMLSCGILHEGPGTLAPG